LTNRQQNKRPQPIGGGKRPNFLLGFGASKPHIIGPASSYGASSNKASTFNNGCLLNDPMMCAFEG